MPTVRTSPDIPVASRVAQFSYAIRNIAVEAAAAEARGIKVRYLNIGDPVAFGFRTPEHLVDAAVAAMRNGHNGYLPSVGIASAREAVAADYLARGVAVSPDRVLITAGTSEAIDLALHALVNAGEEVLVPSPTYPLYTAVLAKIGASPKYYRADPANRWLPDPDEMRSLITPRTRVIVVIDPNNPTGAIYPPDVRRSVLQLAEENGLAILADEVYGDLGFDGPVPLLGSLEPTAPILSFSSLSKAYLAPGWRTGWMVVAPTPRLDPVLTALKKLADARLCSPGPMQHAITAALAGDRSHQISLRADLAERGRVTAAALNAIPGVSCVPPRAAFYALPSVALPPSVTDEDYVRALVRETGILCVHGSGFGTEPSQGFFRVVFLAEPDVLRGIYGDIATFTKDFLSRG